MVLTTFSSALISELDIVLLGLFYFGPALGVLAWSRKCKIIFFFATADVLFQELSKAEQRRNSKHKRSSKESFLFSFIIPVTFC